MRPASGASVPCLPLATSCRDSTGYVGLVQRRLAETRTVSLLNLALPGGVLSPDVEALGDELGRNIPGNFLTHLAPFVPPGTTLVTIFAGGNDTNTIALAIGAGPRRQRPVGGSSPSRCRAFARDYGRLIDSIRSRAPGAFIVVMNAPNFGALPYIAGTSARRAAHRAGRRRAADREAINPLASRVPVVDLMCDARSRTSRASTRPTASTPAIRATPIWPRCCCRPSPAARPASRRQLRVHDARRMNERTRHPPGNAGRRHRHRRGVHARGTGRVRGPRDSRLPRPRRRHFFDVERLRRETVPGPGWFGFAVAEDAGASSRSAGTGRSAQHAEACELFALYVDPAAQRRGIGRALVEQAVDAAHEDGARRLDVAVMPGNMPAVRFYQACGFTAAGEREIYAPHGEEGGPPVALLYTRNL